MSLQRTTDEDMRDDDLTAAPATPLVLTALAEGDSYGFAILKRVRELSGGRVEWPDGMLYPLLHRLRRLGYVADDWRTVSEGQRRRYYRLTPARRASAQIGRQESASSPDSSARMLSCRLPSHSSRLTGLALVVAGSSFGGGG